MPIYLYRLAPPRPTFPSDMTAAEGKAMERHFTYWGAQLRAGKAGVVGPVMDPKGAYGIAVLDVTEEAEARRLCAQDPVISASLGFTFALYAMPNALVGTVSRAS